MLYKNKYYSLTSDSKGGLGPASRSSTFQVGTSLRRAASAAPEDPPPTIRKSYFSKSKI